MERLQRNDYVQNFKREFVEDDFAKYLYQILDVAYHSETGEKVVIYKALYAPYDTWVRPYEMFMSKVDKEKYPQSHQVYRFEKVDIKTKKRILCDATPQFSFQDLKVIIEELRSKNGCPWDRKQTFESMKECLKNESEEVFQAVDNKDMKNLCEELGDVLLQVMMNSQIASEEDLFTIEDVIQGVSAKLVRRHPHVFKEDGTKSPEEALDSWKKIKELEKAGKL